MHAKNKKFNLKAKVFSLLLLAFMPLMTGCALVAPLAAGLYGSLLLWDIVLIPVRSFLGGLALDFVNTH